MSQPSFDIYFAGQLLPDFPVETAKQWVGKQFKLQGNALDRLFSGASIRIKQGVDGDTAERYQAAFRQVGALLEIRPVTDSTAAAIDPAGSGDNGPELLPAHTGSLEDCAAVISAAPVPNIDHLDLDNAEQPLDDRPATPPPAIATEHLSAAPANSGDLSDCVQEKPARAIPDISQLKLVDD